MVHEEGYTKSEVAQALGVTRSAVGKWPKLYEETGWKGLRLGQSGRCKGDKTRLSEQQCKQVIKWITDKTPDQLKMPFVLWTAVAVRDLIQ